jgi:hypothetical protein
MNDKKKYKTEHEEQLPPDYQSHLDGADETIEEKMQRLDNWMAQVNSNITNKPLF